MKLEEGKVYSNEELAKWFQIQERSFTKAKRKKLKYLEFFADFEEEKRKVRIIKVYHPEYVNPRDKEQNDKTYQKAIAKIIAKYPLQLFITCTGRVVQLQDKDLEKLQHKITTCYQYVRRNLKEIADGSKREWCQRFYNDEIDFVPLDDDQLAFWKEVLNQVFGKEQSEIIAEIKSQQDQNELTAQEAEQYLLSTISYQWDKAKHTFYNKYGFEPVSVSRWELNAIVLKILEEE